MAGEVTTGVRETSQSSICRLMVELETGGNIRLEDGKPSDMWCAPRMRPHCCSAHLFQTMALAAGWLRVTTGSVAACHH